MVANPPADNRWKPVENRLWKSATRFIGFSPDSAVGFPRPARPQAGAGNPRRPEMTGGLVTRIIRESSSEGGPQQELLGLVAGAHMDRVDRQIAAWGRQGAGFQNAGNVATFRFAIESILTAGNDFQKPAGSHRLDIACSPSPHRPAADRRRRAGTGIRPARGSRRSGKPAPPEVLALEGSAAAFPGTPRRDAAECCTVDGEAGIPKGHAVWGFGERLQILSPAVRHPARSTP